MKQLSAKKKFIITFIFLSEFAVSQVVTPWITTGDKSKLLQQQSTLSFEINSTSGGNTLTINPTSVYQTIDGFGFCLTEGSAEVITSLANTQQSALLNELFDKNNGLGISMLRISIGASDLSSSNYSYNETSGDINMTNFSLAGPDLTYLIPILKKALSINPDIKILATPWSAPRWMKSNNSWVGGSLNTASYAAYANYFVKYLDAMKALGINIWAITPQNEPENPNNNPSLVMNSTEQKNFINNNLGPALSAAGYSGVKIIAFDHNCDNTAYPIDVCNNSSYVDGAAFHLYAGNISALSTVKNATGKNIYFTEQYTGSGGNFSGDLGWHLQNVIIGSSNNWAKAILEWNLANNSSIGPNTVGGCTTCLGAITVNNSTSFTRNVSYYIIGQISKFVRPGASRIAVTSNNTSINATAFLHSDGTIALICYNSSSSAQIVKICIGTNSFSYLQPALSVVTYTWNNSLVQGISKLFDNTMNLNILPNPVHSELRFSYPEMSNALFELFSINGLLVYSTNILNSNHLSIKTEFLKNGVYFVKLTNEKKKYCGRFIKV